MKKTNEVFDNTSTLEREEGNVGFGPFGVQPTAIGGNVGYNRFGFELPVTRANPQLAYSTIPFNTPVVPMQQPFFGFAGQTMQPFNTAMANGFNPTFGWGVQNPYLTGVQASFLNGQINPFITGQITPFGMQTGFAGTNFANTVAPVTTVGGTTAMQPVMTTVPTATTGLVWNPFVGTYTTQEQLITNLTTNAVAVQTQTLAGAITNATTAATNGKREFVSWIPETNILETEKTFRIEMSVPGVSRENCKVGIEKGILWVSGTRTTDAESKVVNVTKKEFSYGTFYRSFILTDIFESDKIQVSCHHGLLSINIPKREVTKKLASEIAVN